MRRLPGALLSTRNQYKLYGAHVFCLQPFGSLFHHERDSRALVERSIPACRYSREMDEDIFTILALDETEAFSSIKPLDRSCFFHVFPLFNIAISTCHGNPKLMCFPAH